MICGAVVLAGLFAFTRLPIELAPSIDFPSLTINTSWGNASPETVEQFVTAPIEEVANTVGGVKNVRSRSSEGRSSVDVEFEQGTDMSFARLELYEKLAALAETFPPGVGVPEIERYVPEDFLELQGFMTFAVAADRPAAVIRAYALERIVPGLLSIKGVARVEIVGGEDRELHVLLEPRRIAAAALTMQAIIKRLNDLDVRVSVGVLSRNDRRLIIGVREHSQRVEDILDLPLAVREHGAVLRLRDVAAVHDTIAETRNVYRINGKPSVTVIVDKEPHINTLSVAERVKATLSEVAKEFPGQLLVTTVTDKSRQMREELENLRREVVVSLALIWIVLVVSLASLRAPLLIMASLVVSLAGTMVVFALLGLSLHLLTLAGLVLGFGRVVDDAIVVLDNIQRRSAAGVSDETMVLGVQQVRLPVIASTITTVGALVPIAFLPKELKPYFGEFALAVGVALLMSLVASCTVIPVAARAMPQILESQKRLERWGEKILAGYRTLLHWCLRRQKFVLALVVLAFGLPVWLLPEHIESDALPAKAYNAIFSSSVMVSIRPFVNHALGGVSHLFFTKVTKGEVWDWGNETYLVVRVGFPQGTELQRYDEVARAVEQEVLAAAEGVRTMTTRVGQDYASVRVDFEDSAATTAIPYILKNRLTVLAAQTGGASISVAGFGPGFYSGGETAPSFYVKVLGYNYRRVKELAERFKQKLEQNPRIAEVDIDRSFGRWPRSTELVAQVDRDALAAHHLSVADVLPWVGSLTRGTVDWRTVTVGGERLPLVVKMQGFDSLGVGELASTRIVNGRGEAIALGGLVTVHERRVMSEILRENQQYVRWISFEYRGPYRYGDQFVDATIRSIPLPHGYKFDRQFGWFMLTEAQQVSMIWLALVALVIVFMVTASLYESFIKPLVVIVSIPLSLIGLFLIFYETNTSFGRGGYAAVMLLMGIVVANAILLMDYLSKRCHGTTSSHDEIVLASADRLRPILMTSLTTIGALLPLLLWSSRTSVWYSLALGTIGGLASSTVLTLLVLPVLFAVVKKSRA
jgi:multidrug efflux pump subunit AcrB